MKRLTQSRIPAVDWSWVSQSLLLLLGATVAWWAWWREAYVLAAFLAVATFWQMLVLLTWNLDPPEER